MRKLWKTIVALKTISLQESKIFRYRVEICKNLMTKKVCTCGLEILIDRENLIDNYRCKDLYPSQITFVCIPLFHIFIGEYSKLSNLISLIWFKYVKTSKTLKYKSYLIVSCLLVIPSCII